MKQEIEKINVNTWSEEDQEWLSTVKPEFQSIAIEYGRMLFAMVMKAAILATSLQKLVEANKHSPSLQEECEVIKQATNDLFFALLQAANVTEDKYADCQRAIQARAFFLQGSTSRIDKTFPPSIVVS